MSKNRLAAPIAAALALAALALLNPKQADFKAYLASRAAPSGKGKGTLIGALSKGVASAAGAAYTRNDYLICSTYRLGDATYLGLAKRIFIKLP
ncbi:MAG TPA: hypothetical protein PLB91_13460 [Spirochaetales bacterium]|nr:hypothetical protein [Spirochaetales bacterium]HRY56027.1 hypothetical protein [Spirochaetia bacterium]HRZ63770.1 hypothetical protein [Spirochaetia bacterium]